MSDRRRSVFPKAGFPKAAPPAPGLAMQELRFSEQFVLWAARFWRQTAPGGDLRFLMDAFRLVGAPGALGPMDGMLMALHAGSPGALRLRAPRQSRLAPSECRLLALVAASAQGDALAARRSLALLAPCAVQRLAGPLVDRFAGDLTAAGLVFPARDWPLPECDPQGLLALEADLLRRPA